MTPSITPVTQIQQVIKDEHILVVPRIQLFTEGVWQGIKHADTDTYLARIQRHKQFMPRSLAEQDPTYKQIIPYLVFMHKERIFIMQRAADASETRLRNKMSVGIGGHIRQEDIEGATIFDWANREFHEEVSYTDSMTITPLGILNDDSNAVGQVHLGLVLLIEGSSDSIRVKSELKSGWLCPLDESVLYKEAMESWSVCVLDTLLNRQAWTLQTP